MTPILAQTDFGSIIVAVTLIVFVGVIAVAAMFRYQTIEDFVKVWAGIGTLVGVLFGSMGTYFFTKEAANQSVAKVEAEKETLLAEKTTATELKTIAEKALAVARETEKGLKEQVVKLEAKSPLDRILVASNDYNPWMTHITLPTNSRPDRNPFATAFELAITDEKERDAFSKTLSAALQIPSNERVPFLARIFSATQNQDDAERGKALQEIQKDIAELAKKDDAPKE